MARRAIGLTATVRVRGPDPRGDIAADAAFFDHKPSSSNDDDDGSGSIDGAPVVAISATALKLPRPASRPPGDDPRTTTDERTRFIAPLALFLPFLDDSARPGSPSSSPLVPGAEVHVRPGRENPGPGDEPGGWIRARVLAATVPRDASDAVDALASTDGLGAIHSSGWSSGGVFPHSSRKNLGAAVTGLVLLDAPVGVSHGGDNRCEELVDGGARAERGGCIRGVRVTVRGAGAVAFFVFHRRGARRRRVGNERVSTTTAPRRC